MIVELSLVFVATMVYPVIVFPPVSAGAVHPIVAVWLVPLTVAVALVGASGVVYGITLLLADE